MIAAHPRKLQIVVLAAGFSARLGRPKVLARIHGVSLLRRTLEAASSCGAERIVVVAPRNPVRYRIEARGVRVYWAINGERERGLSSSVRRGIAAARYSSAVLFLPADLVHLTRRDLLTLVQRWRSAPRRVIARRTGLSGVIPLILPRWLYARVSTLAGDVGLRELVAQLPADNRVLVDLPSAIWDVDTPRDLRHARRRFRPQINL
jgi:molybdenum cofactor cytidylyltransferase